MELLSSNPTHSTLKLFEPISLPTPKTHLSTKDTHAILEGREIALLNLDDYWSDRAWKNTVLSVFTLSLLTGFIKVLLLGTDTITFDKSSRVVTPYTCPPQHFTCDFDVYEKDANGNFFNYTKTNLNHDFSVGLKSGINIALAPPILIGLVWGILKLCEVAYRTLKQKSVDAHNLHINNMLASLESSNIDENTMTPPKFIPELVDLDFLAAEDYALLSFEQIEAIKNKQPEVFEQLLNDQVFSEEQRKALNALEHLLHLPSSKALCTELYSCRYDEIFENDPKILEVLILKLPKKCLNKDVINCLAITLKIFKNVDGALRINNLEQIVKLMNENNYSFGLGVRNFQMQTLIGEDVLQLQFFDADKNPINIKVSKKVMIQTSSYFKDLFSDCYIKEKSLKFEAINPKYFQEAILFLLTGVLKLTKTEDLFQLFEVGNYFGMIELTDKIDSLISLNLLTDKNNLNDLLELAQKLNLKSLPPSISLKLSCRIAVKEMVSWFFSDDFIIHLTLIQKFSLYPTLKKLADLIALHLEELLKNKNFMVRFLEAIHIHQGLFSCISLQFSKKPHLLKCLWDVAILQKSEIMENEIILFCNKLENADVVFKNWNFPPVAKRNKNDTVILFDEIEMEEI